MRTRTKAAIGLLSGIGLLFSSGVAAHPEDTSDGGVMREHGGGNDGHVAANTNYGFEAVGHSPLSGVQNGRYTDVWAHEGFAYVGSFQDPDCSRAGVYIADLADPTDPEFVGEIKSPPSTRVNDVKVTDVGDKDVLIFSLEKCGDFVGANSRQKGQGGIALWDVTDPTNPHALKQNFLDFQVHNTYPWTDRRTGRTYALVVDDENIDDLHVVDLTKPQSPKQIATTGIGSWLADEAIAADLGDELFMGTFAASLLHDVWVEWNERTGRYEGVLSYWDAGFITIDLSDPKNPTFIADSDYLETDPILAEDRAAFGGRPEGNAHAAVFGGEDSEFIFGGDEDFDANAVTIASGTVEVAANDGSDTPPVADNPMTGQLRFVGLACDASVPEAAAGQIALIERGACAFTTKAANITAAGYAGGIVFNSAPNGCDSGIGMLVAGTVPMVSVTRGDGFALMGLDCTPDTIDVVPEIGTTFGEADVSAAFVGWGYFWVINNSGSDVTVNQMGNSRMMHGVNDAEVGPMGTIGYYAPEEVSDPTKAQGAGDLSMHNVETDIVEGERDRAFISWYALGMRAVEWRDGHYHDSDAAGQSVDSWNVHEVGRWIAPFQDDPDASVADKQQIADFAADAGVGPDDLAGSNFWGVTQFEQDGVRYVLGSDRNTGLWVFTFDCVGVSNPEGTLYCDNTLP